MYSGCLLIQRILAVSLLCRDVTCQYDQNPDQKGRQQEREQHSAQCGGAVLASFAAGLNNGSGHGRQKDEAHILHLSHCKRQCASDAEDELVDAAAQENELYHLSQNRLEKVIL